VVIACRDVEKGGAKLNAMGLSDDGAWIRCQEVSAAHVAHACACANAAERRPP